LTTTADASTPVRGGGAGSSDGGDGGAGSESTRCRSRARRKTGFDANDATVVAGNASDGDNGDLKNSIHGDHLHMPHSHAPIMAAEKGMVGRKFLQSQPAFALLTAFIAAAELNRATIGRVEPSLNNSCRTLFTLRDNYCPGDLEFDPLGLKPTDAKDFANMQTKELQNGWLAMISVAGIMSQELVNQKTIFATIDFYELVYSGIDPYL
jgi:Chlorophyll A-B binding protein